MPLPIQALPTIGQPGSTEDPKVRAALLEIQQILNPAASGLDAANIAASLLNRITGRPAASLQLTATYTTGPAVAAYAFPSATFRGGPVIIVHTGGRYGNPSSGVTQDNKYAIAVDLATVIEVNNGTVGAGGTGALAPSVCITTPAAGAHIISVKHVGGDGSGSTNLSGAGGFPIQFAYAEL